MPRDAGGCAYVLGADGLTRWREPHSGAWLGLLQTHRQLTRELESRLEARFGLSLSGLELLGRLAAAPGHRLRLSAIAGATGLTLSRISRIVDAFEKRGLVERRRNPSDRRAYGLFLTESGRSCLEAAVAAADAEEEALLGGLDPAQREQLERLLREIAERQGLGERVLP